MTKRKLTPKQRVLRKYPGAWAYQWREGWDIYSHPVPIGGYMGCSMTEHSFHNTASAAWAAAAKGLK